jgi:hypothetical protein
LGVYQISLKKIGCAGRIINGRRTAAQGMLEPEWQFPLAVSSGRQWRRLDGEWLGNKEQ